MKINAKNITLKKITTAPAVKKIDKNIAVKDNPAKSIDFAWPWPQEIDKILEACRKSSYVVINDHNGKPEVSRIGVWLHRNNPEWNEKNWEEWHVVWLPKDGSMCCLNPIYLDDNGIPHLSTWSVGDNVWAGWPSSMHPEKNIAEGIAAYNWQYLGTEVEHEHPCDRIEGIPLMYDNRLLYCEGRHEKYYWNEDLEEVQKFRF